MSSIHDRLGRVRPPRVHIRYDVEIGGAMVKKELPFVVGVLGDFSGQPSKDGKPVELKPLKDRKFIQIDRDNFNEIMEKMTPGVSFRVENTLKKDGTEFPVQLEMKSIEDFDPGRVVEQVPALKSLLETRNKLRDLLTKVDRSEDLERILEQVLQNTEQLKKLNTELGTGAAAGGADPS